MSPPRLQPAKFRQSKLYILAYVVSLNFVVQILIPFTTLIACNYKTYMTIKESEKNLSTNYSIHFKSRRAAIVRRQPPQTQEDSVRVQMVDQVWDHLNTSSISPELLHS